MMLDRRHLLMSFGAAALAGCSALPRPQPIVGDVAFTDIGFADWTDAEAEYLLYPGDEIEVAIPTASELTRTQRVGPDGRIAMPLVGQVMAADRTLYELGQSVSQAYVGKLVRPVVEVSVKTPGPINVWVDGEVRTPGIYAMTGDLSAQQAVIQAGGLLPSGKPQNAALIRRGPGGTRMLKVVDVRAVRGQPEALRRGDIIFVPKSTLGELAAFFTQFKAALPIGFSYSINGANGSGFANF